MVYHSIINRSVLEDFDQLRIRQQAESKKEDSMHPHYNDHNELMSLKPQYHSRNRRVRSTFWTHQNNNEWRTRETECRKTAAVIPCLSDPAPLVSYSASKYTKVCGWRPFLQTDRYFRARIALMAITNTVANYTNLSIECPQYACFATLNCMW